MDICSTADFGWSNRQVRAARDLGDLTAEIVTTAADAGAIREGTATTAALTIAAPGSAAVRVRNRLTRVSAVFGLDGAPALAEGHRLANGAEIGVMKAAQALLDRWSADPAPLAAAGVL